MKMIIPYLAFALALVRSSANPTSKEESVSAVPATGVVRVGDSLPGFSGTRVNLMSTRAEVDAEYGDPSCLDLPYYKGPSGIDGICTYDVPGSNNGVILKYFSDTSRGQATGGPDDIFLEARWSGTDLNWETEEGVSCASALNDPESAVAAYPNAVVQRYRNNNPSRIEDAALGISIRLDRDTERGSTSCTMMIFVPRPADYHVSIE